MEAAIAHFNAQSLDLSQAEWDKVLHCLQERLGGRQRVFLALILHSQASQQLLAALPSIPAIQDGCRKAQLKNDARCRDYLIWAGGHSNIGEPLYFTPDSRTGTATLP